MGTLILQDGSVIKGNSKGAIGGYEGEIVFNTSMAGYQEILTDLSYAKQIVVMSYPEIGNYGINEIDFEAQNPALVGIIAKNFCEEENHYKSTQNISTYLQMHNIIALDDIDTRALVKKIRENGTQSAFITSNDLTQEEIEEKIQHLQEFKISNDVILQTGAKEKYQYNDQGEIDLAFIDYGTKNSILNTLAKKGCKITVYPPSVSAQEILENNHHALFLSSGPANPNEFSYQIEQIKEIVGKIPLFGVGLGYQLLALCAGAEVYKLKSGHRGTNYPVINLENKKILITNQNHGYAVKSDNLAKFIRATYKNLNDDTLEGFEIDSLKVYAVQFYPETTVKAEETTTIYDEWVNIAKREINNKNNEVKNER